MLEDINLTIPFGQRVAFVGPSGSGKSTLAKMFLRLYDPDEGSCRFGDETCATAARPTCASGSASCRKTRTSSQTSIRENLLVV